MSAKNSAKKPVAFNEANEALYDAFQAVPLPDYFPTDPPWPEWNDFDINAETWGNGNKKPQTTSKGAGKTELPLESAPVNYTDPEQSRFPPELDKYVASWKRPHEVFPSDVLTIYSGAAADVSLRSPSEYTCNWDLFKVVSEICCLLHYHAATEPFPTECETPYYVSNTKGQPWQPWHHIYGFCKAGKDQPHRPVYYPYGKYILRLYYFGAWRKLTVDDLVPCDANGKCMLPVTETPGELWPILLVKGVLKIAGLTQTCCTDQMDIPVWTLLTGWPIGKYPMWKGTTEQTWRLLTSLSPQFSPTEQPEREKVASRMTSISSKGTAKKPVERKESKQDESRALLTIADLGNFPVESELHGGSYPVAILMTRDVPLRKSTARKSTERWKRIRWVHWAASKGLWTDENLIPPYRCLYMINFVKELYPLLSPDPAVESRLFVPDEDEDDDVGAAPADSPLQWVDYYKFIKYTTNLSFLLKPSSLISKHKLTYINLGPAPSTAVGGKAAKPAPASEPSNYYMHPIVKVSGNEPPILYCESLTGIFILFSLWVYPLEPVENRSYLSSDQPSCVRVYHGSIIVEKYDWRSTPQNRIVAAVKTVGNDTASVFLNPGRHAFRIWLDTDSPFLIEILSNTEVTVGKGPKIRFLMSMESFMITEYVNRVSNAFIELAQKFGRPDHSRNLTQFYSSIRPRNTITPGYEGKMNHFIDAFAASILTVLKSLVASEEELRWMTTSLRSLFLNPFIPCPIAKATAGTSPSFQKKPRKEPAGATSAEKRERTLSDLIARPWTEEEISKAVTIQRMYRGHHVRELVRYRSPNSKEYRVLVEKLKKICDVMFVPSKREIEVARLIRETITVRRELLPTFLFYRDISNVTVTEEFTGRITGVEPKAWVPMIRFTFVCHSSDPLPCAFYHSCNLEQYTVSVTDNDTNEEIFRLVNTTCPHWYRRNQTGYTIFVYGWNESDTKTVNWRLEMVKMKYFLDIHPCNTTLISVTGNQCNPYQPQPLSMQEVRNFYVPNKQNKICTCLIKVRKRLSVTIRLSVSFEDARFFARIHLRTNIGYSDSETSTEDADTVIEAEAKSSAIIFPSVMLEHYQKSRVTMDSKEDQNGQTVYVLEAFVVGNTWPLTKHEWGVVEPIRVNSETWRDSVVNVSQSRKSSTGSRRRSLRTSKSGLPTAKVVESPFWYLQVVTDSSPDLCSVLEVTEDRSYQEMIKGMKQSWEENDPGRRQRGKAIQREFLKAIFDESRKLSNLELDEYSSEIKNFDGDANLAAEDSFEALLHEMRSFSYLINDKSQDRYLKSPRILPWTPMDEIFTKYSQGKFGVDFMSLQGSTKNLSGEDYEIPNVPEISEEGFDLARRKLLTELRRQRMILEDNFVRENNRSLQLMDQAYEERKHAIEKIKALRGKPEVKSDDGKGGMTKK